jgi:hypothetical protein
MVTPASPLPARLVDVAAPFPGAVAREEEVDDRRGDDDDDPRLQERLAPAPGEGAVAIISPVKVTGLLCV